MESDPHDNDLTNEKRAGRAAELVEECRVRDRYDNDLINDRRAGRAAELVDEYRARYVLVPEPTRGCRCSLDDAARDLITDIFHLIAGPNFGATSIVLYALVDFLHEFEIDELGLEQGGRMTPTDDELKEFYFLLYRVADRVDANIVERRRQSAGLG